MLLPADRRREEFESLLASILDQINELAEAIAQLYFSHAAVPREIGALREDPQL